MQTTRTKVADALRMDPRSGLRVQGWVRTLRDSKNVVFIELNDGSGFASLQVVAAPELDNFEDVRHLTTGSAIVIEGELVESPAKGQRVELKAETLEVVGRASDDYPLQKKRHGFEFLRGIAHLRIRTNTFGAVFRVRNVLARAIHRFYQDRGFIWVHTPVITGSDAEGAGELFRVTGLDVDKPPRTKAGAIDWDEDFFGKATFLTVSGQLNAEAFALGFNDVYTFGPTFRAENSNTSRHAAEFWMIEPEVAFCDLQGDCDLAEDFVRFVLQTVLAESSEDLEFFNKWIDKGLIGRLEEVANADFERMQYAEAVERLTQSGQTFEFPVHFGANLQAEHERYITEKIVGRPTFLTDYPKEIKAFYMRRNDDGRTVAAMDLLVPKVGELIGGSQREERADVLERAITEAGLPLEEYGWYLDLRRYGSVPHAGFGLGFERLIMYATGMENIRDVIPFPRTPRQCSF